ncbi:MAG: cation diffusion facilitator family transporter, partial [Coriobacteriales bacterium]
GYGRVEYLSASIISVIVLYAGISAFVESAKKIVSPETADYSAVALLIIAVAVVVKIVLGLYVQRTGRKVNSDALVASGKDALFDSVISASTLLAAAIYLLFGISLEAWLGAIIAIVIIKSGIDMLRDTVSQILGARPDADFTGAVKSSIMEFPQVLGVYDLVINNYGPESMIGSVHLELPETMSVGELDDLEYDITVKLAREFNLIMTGISVYATNPEDPVEAAMRKEVYAITESFDEVINTHGFHLDEENRTIRFDVVIDFDAKRDRDEVYGEICEKAQAAFPDYHLLVILDSDVTD